MLGEDRTALVDERAEDLRAADVDTDGNPRSHSREVDPPHS